jgi:RNA polymerase sigma-70 factor, ECF subfamily
MSAIASADILLMVQVRNGDASLFGVLVERYRHDLVGYLYRMIANHAVAEELAQETFLRAYRSRDSYQPTAKFTTWIYSIATRLALNWLRDNRVRRHYEPLEGLATEGRPRQFADPSPLADAALVYADRVRSVRLAVAGLPGRQRSVVLMHKYYDMSYEEIAAALNCSPQAVKSLLFRAYTALRQKLAVEFCAERTSSELPS